MKLNSEYILKTTPKAKKEMSYIGDKYRFTVLTSRLIRIEYNENGVFEDRATQCVVNRDFQFVPYKTDDRGNILTITTKDIRLTYTKRNFSRNSLRAEYINENAGVSTWYYGEDEPEKKLDGTTRTLDKVDGKCELEEGIMSAGGFSVLDDSKSLVISDNGEIVPREEKCIDIYLFCYGSNVNGKNDYLGCLKDFYKLTGNTPMLPRFALGNWWSRYHAYTQEEYENLITRFEKEKIPFSVAVVDMDWHLVKIDKKYGTGWTGYSWNTDLFPDHKGFLDFLHRKGLKTSLNLHPREGVAAHEDAYEEMAVAMGKDPSLKETISFEIENNKFINNYFKILHNPMEKEGVDFWWIDWQQGNTTYVEGLDPLWMLNHYHFLDSRKNGKRGLIFSRYAGPGSHRYPIGFSGDTVVSWKSLDFQPYFTASASNIGYTWWSHDIGGHMQGIRDDELTARWVQLGVFSPINRLHSCHSAFMGKEPWKYNRDAEYSMRKFLNLRHSLVPYLYTMNYRTYKYSEPLVMPLYYRYDGYNAYHNHRNEYIFGTEMIVSPITKPKDEKTTMGSVNTYIPEGKWYDFFSNRRYTGGRCLKLYRTLDEIPVLVKEGGIVPMNEGTTTNDVANPEKLRIKIFTGKNNTFELYEDDGESSDYERGVCSITNMTLLWDKEKSFELKVSGNYKVKREEYILEFIGIKDITDFEIVSDDNITAEKTENEIPTLTVRGVKNGFKVILKNVVKTENPVMEDIFDVLLHMQESNDLKGTLYSELRRAKGLAGKLAYLASFDADENVKSAVLEILAADMQNEEL